MKLKNTIWIFVSLFLALATVSSAFSSMFPQIVSGKITAKGFDYVGGMKITQENIRTGAVYEVTTDTNGYYLVDWSNYPFHDGDKIKITVDACKSLAACNKEVMLDDGVGIMVNFDITPDINLDVEVIKEIEKQVTYVCWDGSQVGAPSSCPVKPEVTVEKEVIKEKIYCSDGLEVSDKSLCLESKSDIKKYAAGAGVTGLGAGLIGLIWYWLKKKRERGKKMLDTVIKKAKK